MTRRKIQSTNKRLSLAPLSFEEAVTDILKAKPEPKPRTTAKGRQAKNQSKRTAKSTRK